MSIITSSINADASPKNIINKLAPNLTLKITNNNEELSKAKKLRLHSLHKTNQIASKQSSKQNAKSKSNSKKLIEQQQLIMHDGYDSFADHLIVMDQHQDVIAYVRLIDSFTAYKIGGYYYETCFNLTKLFNSKVFYLEFSRLVVDSRYQNEQTLALIWSGIIHHAQSKGIDAIIGSISLSLSDRQTVYPIINHLKANYMSDGQQRVIPYQLLPDAGSDYRPITFKEVNPVARYFFEQGARLCGDAYWNRDLNCAELLTHYQLNNTPLFPECIRINDVELGLLCK